MSWIDETMRLIDREAVAAVMDGSVPLAFATVSGAPGGSSLREICEWLTWY